MPTGLSRFFRGRREAAPTPGAVGTLRLVEALLRQASPRRRWRLATWGLRRAGYPVALAVAWRPDGQGGLAVRVLAGRAAGVERTLFFEALASRLSPLHGEGTAGPRWIAPADDPFQPGAAFLRRVDLACALALPIPPEGAAEGERVTLLAASREALPRGAPAVQDTLAAWSLAVTAIGPGWDGAGDPSRGAGGWNLAAAWEAAPAALALVDGDTVPLANPEAERLLRASVGSEGQGWPFWLAGAARRLEETGQARELLRASRSRDVTLEVALGGRAGGRGGRGGRVVAVRDATAEVRADSRSAEAISTISHELRTPLTSMKNSVGLLLRGEAGALPPPARHFLDMTMRNIDRLNRLIGDLLDVSRAAAGRLDINRRTVDIVPLVREALELFAATARQRRIALGFDGGDEAFPAHVDGDKLVQMLHNTVGNALKFTPEGGRVRVWLNPRPGNGAPADARSLAERCFLPLRTFALVVEDNGVGMSDEVRRTLFQPFARGEGGDGGAATGTGLGLHITRTLVEAHGGHISVESALDAGTTVWIVMPRDAESERVLVAVRRLRRLRAARPAARLATLDARRPGETPDPAELRRASRVVREFVARLDGRAAGGSVAAGAGPFGLGGEADAPDGVEEPAPALWTAVVEDWSRLAAAWEVERARPGAPALLEQTAWDLPEPADGPAGDGDEAGDGGHATAEWAGAPETEGY